MVGISVCYGFAWGIRCLDRCVFVLSCKDLAVCGVIMISIVFYYVCYYFLLCDFIDFGAGLGVFLFCDLF